MLSKLKAITNGWRNYVFSNPQAEALARQRAKACAQCPQAVPSVYAELIDYKAETVSGLVCHICHCPLSRKTRSTTETCPLNVWKV